MYAKVITLDILLAVNFSDSFLVPFHADVIQTYPVDRYMQIDVSKNVSPSQVAIYVFIIVEGVVNFRIK